VVGKLLLTLIVVCDTRLQPYKKSKVNGQSENHIAYTNELSLVQLCRNYVFDSERKIKR